MPSGAVTFPGIYKGMHKLIFPAQAGKIRYGNKGGRKLSMLDWLPVLCGILLG
jgi:hypothetical protein